MLIADHINFSGANPLMGPNLDAFGPRFPDVSDLYTAKLREQIKIRAAAAEIPLEEGVYLMCSGPNYETPAEIRAFRTWGADAVGMSTVPEALVAGHCGMRVVGVSCITNMAAGILPVKLNHAEVTETANRVRQVFRKLVDLILTVV
jgi:purine-nucleoside phosphorylase